MTDIRDSSEIYLKILDAACDDAVKAALIDLLDWEKTRLDQQRSRYKEDYRKVLSKHVSEGGSGE